MQLMIVSGLSGAGKSVALHTLEDEGFYCVDNLPTSMLTELARRMSARSLTGNDRIAVGIDARGEIHSRQEFESIVSQVESLGIDTKILFLDASNDALLTRFSETRRKHPLSHAGAPLDSAIETERCTLAPLIQLAGVRIDTSNLNLHQLREVIRRRVLGLDRKPLNVLIQSFGFKYGPPPGTDFVFDVRCLPNPYWDVTLRSHTGLDEPVAQFLSDHESVRNMIDDIGGFFIKWIPIFENENRAYLTISIGCTGGRHRSVYITDQIRQSITGKVDHLTIKHRELD